MEHFRSVHSHRPVATTLLVAAIALAGSVAFKLLPVARLPQMDFPTIAVAATLPGASPAVMASSVATPLERQFGRIAGVTQMTSTSYLGTTGIVLQFDLNRDINAAARDVQAAINAARGYLPTNLPANPTYRKVNPADAPIMIISLTSDVYGPGRLYDAASTIMQQKLSQIQGVGQVLVGGSSLPGVRVEINPTQLNSFGLGLEDVRTMLSVQNVNRPKGQISDNPTTTANLATNDQLLKAEDYKPLVVGYHNGAEVQLSDIADVQDSVEDIRAGGLMNGKIAVLVIVSRQPGANIIDTVDRIKAALPQLKASLPVGLTITIVLDQTTTIRASVHDVEVSLLISIALVILVVFAFLRSPRATFIPGIVVPVSLVGTFGVMYLAHFNLDNLSLMALTISTGFVVDDAIVVIENVTRYLEQGVRPMQAALEGAQEIGFTVLSISISLIAVFIPILLMGGIVGRLFREFAVTLSVAIFVSLVISLTATPMMCSRLLKHQTEDSHGKLYRASEKIFNGMLRGYEYSLTWVLRHSALVFGGLLLTIALNLYLLAIVPKGFFPQEDTGRLTGGIQAEQDISYQAMRARVARFVEIVKSDPGVDNVMAFTGAGTGNTTNTAFMFCSLKPLSERDANADGIINRLRPQLADVPGATLFLQATQDLTVGGRRSNAQYQYTIQSDTLADLTQWGPILLQEMRKLPGLTDVNTDQQNSGLEASLVYDRQTASRLGVSPQLLDNTLYDAFGQRQVSTMDTQLNEYHLVMEVAPQFWQNPTALSDIYLHPPKGGEIPLSALTHYEPSIAPLAVNHQGQFPSVTLSFNLAPGVALSDAVRLVTDMEQRINMPSSIQGAFSGTLQAFQTSLASEPMLILAALVAVYIVLGILYESYIHPITILSTLPSAGVGAVLALLITHTDLSVIAHDRDYLADRHRQEKRDSDDRLRFSG